MQLNDEQAEQGSIYAAIMDKIDGVVPDEVYERALVVGILFSEFGPEQLHNMVANDHVGYLEDRIAAIPKEFTDYWSEIIAGQKATSEVQVQSSNQIEGHRVAMSHPGFGVQVLQDLKDMIAARGRKMDS